ncbi:MAG: TOBE domain-containing protein [Methylotetracoccus sp.]
MAEVSVRLKGDTRLIGSIQSRSVDTLGLALGKEVMALVQASMIVLVTDFEGYRLSARNQLPGTVIRIHEGAVNVDVVIELPGGDLISASISGQSYNDLALTPGSPVTAVFKSSALIMAGLRSYSESSATDD